MLSTRQFNSPTLLVGIAELATPKNRLVRKDRVSVQLKQAGLNATAELVHDLDIKDERYGRAETSGFLAQVQGITLLHETGERRIELGSQLLDAPILHFVSKEKRHA